MKLLLELLVAVSVCAGSAIPLVPGDNSHYVEGESRYVWLPDGDGVPRLVDLQETVGDVDLDASNGALNTYTLFTRRNPNAGQVIVHGLASSISDSNYNTNMPLMVVVHGWNSDGNSEINTLITKEYLDAIDANVIVVDWRGLANSPYTNAVRGVPGVGLFLGNFLKWLIDNTGGNWNTVHLVGFSLGAHIVGNAGRTAGRLPIRITGLDPAGPQWGNNPNALNANDGQYVEAIHTDGGILGIFDPIAKADFYPNGGRSPQPGCIASICSHSRAYELFAASINNDRFVGQCANINNLRRKCSGPLNMGNGNLWKQGYGTFTLTTGNRWPF